MNHVKSNWKKYALALAGALVAGLAAQGYIPAEVSVWLLSLLPS
jgi:hypothetical protein